MKFHAYQEYKNTDIEWFTQIPKHWNFFRARMVGVFSASGIDKKLDDSEIQIKMFNYLDVYNSKDKILRYSEDLMDTTTTAEKILEHSLKQGDFLFTPSSETANDIGHAALVDKISNAVVFSYHLIRFKPSCLVAPNFFRYLLNSNPIRSYFESVCTGTTRMVLSRDDFKNTLITLPSLSEQTNISIFLDSETDKIDTLVKEQERLIDLLKENRQALLSSAVTAGLNPQVKTKKTGIEWLEQIPAHWEIKKLKFVANVFSSNVDKKSYEDEIPCLLCNYKDVYYNEVIQVDMEFMQATATLDQIEKLTLKNDDVIITKDSESPDDIGVSSHVPCDLNGVVCGYHLAIIRPSNIDGMYLKRLFDSKYLKSKFAILANGLTRYGLGRYSVDNVYLPIPPRLEQAQIVEFINTKCSIIDELSSQAKNAISLLHERRSALISAVVTGQIDVRNYQIKAVA